MVKENVSTQDGQAADDESGASSGVLESGVKLAGEAFVAPGTSLILDGEIASGGAHLVGGLLAKWAVGPVGWVVLAANSYSKSVTDKNLYEHIGGAFKKKEAPAG